MRDVSRLAGVSTMTVSRVLADPATVASDTRMRVMQAVEQLGYVPDRVAGSLSSRRTNFVGLILPTLTNSNFGDTAQGLAETLGPRGYQLLIGYTLYRVAEEEQLVRAMLARRPDAIVIAGS
ncbi:MAG TPA: LacI family DNA-binding transcriptional regulator, partial [Devosia sp.]|nr:LacI family DNA-binding transcriptional regulator [Devosia sp.]